MTQNLDNALHGVQEARTAIFVERADAETHEQMDAVTEIDTCLSRAETMIKEYNG